MAVRVVTDSTAYLPGEVADAAGLTIVPLIVTISGEDGREGVDVSPEAVARDNDLDLVRVGLDRWEMETTLVEFARERKLRKFQ